MGVLLGLGVAVAYGGADFIGGFSSRRSPLGAVVLLGQAAGLVAALVYALAVGGELAGRDLLLGAASGLAGLFGLTFLYRGLAVGTMAVVAPITAVANAVLAISWGLLQGERPTAVAIVGVTFALSAVVVIAQGSSGDDTATASRATQVLFGVLGGTGFGIALVCFAETSDGSGLWPGLIARSTTVPLTLLILLVGRRALLPHRDDRPLVAGGGALDATANAFQILAVREGLLSLVAPVSALYPAGTVLLARIVLDEHLGRRRLAGLALALLGLVLIAI